MFGEQALIYKKKRGAHCIVVSNECSLCVMNDQDFTKVFGPLQMQEEEKRKVFIEKEILADPEMRSLTRVIGINFTKRRYPKSKVLFSEDDRPEKLYFVYEGQILLWTGSLEAKDKDKKKLMQMQENNEQKELIIDFTPKQTQKYDIMLSGAGKMVGEEEMFSGQRRRYNAVVDAECLVYEIEFERMHNVCFGNHFVRNILQQKIADKIKLVNMILDYKRLLESVTENLQLDDEPLVKISKAKKESKIVKTGAALDYLDTDKELFSISSRKGTNTIRNLADCIARTKIKPTYVNPLMKELLQPSIFDAGIIIEALVSVKKKPKAEWSPLLCKLKETELKLKMMLQKEAQAYQLQEMRIDTELIELPLEQVPNDVANPPSTHREQTIVNDRESFLSARKKRPQVQGSGFKGSSENSNPIYVTQQEYEESQLTGGENPKSSSGILTNVPDHDSMLPDISSAEKGRFMRHLKQYSVRVTNWGDDINNTSRKKLANPTLVRCLKQMELRKALELSKQTESLTGSKKKDAVVGNPNALLSIAGDLRSLKPTIRQTHMTGSKLVDSPLWARRTNSLNGLAEFVQESATSLVAVGKFHHHSNQNCSLAGEVVASQNRSIPEPGTVRESGSPSKDPFLLVRLPFGHSAENPTAVYSNNRVLPKIVHKSHQSLHTPQDILTARSGNIKFIKQNKRTNHRGERSLEPNSDIMEHHCHPDSISGQAVYTLETSYAVAKNNQGQSSIQPLRMRLREKLVQDSPRSIRVTSRIGRSESTDNISKSKRIWLTELQIAKLDLNT
jgi:CRP-like cAMP-binding protein